MSKIFINKTEIGEAYLKEIQEKYNIRLEYGDPTEYRYSKPLKKLLELCDKKFIKVGDTETPYYTLSYPLPDSVNSKLKELKLIYSLLHNKYTIWGWDDDKNLISFEYISEQSVKELVNTIEKIKQTK